MVVSPLPFPEGTPALSPRSRAASGQRKATVAPLQDTDRSHSTLKTEPALRAAAAADALTVGVVSRL